MYKSVSSCEAARGHTTAFYINSKVLLTIEVIWCTHSLVLRLSATHAENLGTTLVTNDISVLLQIRYIINKPYTPYRKQLKDADQNHVLKYNA